MGQDENTKCFRNGVIVVELTPDHILSFHEAGFVPDDHEYCIDALLDAYPKLNERDRCRTERIIGTIGTDDEKARFAKLKTPTASIGSVEGPKGSFS